MLRRIYRVYSDISNDYVLGEHGQPTKLAYDTDTCIVYWMFEESEIMDRECRYRLKVGYLCPYIGPNGGHCKLMDGKIVEI